MWFLLSNKTDSISACLSKYSYYHNTCLDNFAVEMITKQKEGITSETESFQLVLPTLFVSERDLNAEDVRDKTCFDKFHLKSRKHTLKKHYYPQSQSFPR